MADYTDFILDARTKSASSVTTWLAWGADPMQVIGRLEPNILRPRFIPRYGKFVDRGSGKMNAAAGALPEPAWGMAGLRASGGRTSCPPPRLPLRRKEKAWS